MLKHQATKLLVRDVLLNWDRREWTLQGFGMLRTYLDDERAYRLHIWSEEDAVEDVSQMHTHPWDFESLVIAGRLVDEAFIEMAREGCGSVPYLRQRILCGEGGGLLGEAEPVQILSLGTKAMGEGHSYAHKARDIHISRPVDGTVTLLQRTFGADVDHASVYWPEGKQWVSAEPRAATEAEVGRICAKALEKWF